SAIAAQSCIVLFGPIVVLADLAPVFTLMPGFAVVYAPLILALGVLARIEVAGPADFLLRTGCLFLLLLYSIACDPLWSMIGAMSFAAAFAAVALGRLQGRTILLRCAALACCGALLLASGVIEYLYTLSQYTARVYFATRVARPADLIYGSILFTSPY